MVNHGVRSSVGLKYLLECDKVQRLQRHCGHALFLGGKSLYKGILFLCRQWGSGPYISRTSLYEHILWMHLEKTRTYACTFLVQRKEINVVKVSFAMRYSSRKLSHEKVINKACNFWRQIACYFQVKSGNVLLLGKKSFEIKSRQFFKPGQGIWAKKFTHAHFVFPPWMLTDGLPVSKFIPRRNVDGFFTKFPHGRDWFLYFRN